MVRTSLTAPNVFVTVKVSVFVAQSAVAIAHNEGKKMGKEEVAAAILSPEHSTAGERNSVFVLRFSPDEARMSVMNHVTGAATYWRTEDR